MTVDGGGAFAINVLALSTTDTIADLVLACSWLYWAWRPENAMAVAHGETMRQLQAGYSACG